MNWSSVKRPISSWQLARVRYVNDEPESEEEVEDEDEFALFRSR